MPELDPRERWRRHMLERFEAMKLSPEFRELRRKLLATLGRKKLVGQDEWWEFSRQKGYWALHDQCRPLAERFGLATWVVVQACLMRGFRLPYRVNLPGGSTIYYEIGADWPRVRVATAVTDDTFIKKLAWAAQRLGVYVETQPGGAESPDTPFPFSMQLNLPPSYPPKAAAELARWASAVGRELMRRMGRKAPQRLRLSPLVPQAAALRVDKGHLSPRGIGNIVQDAYRVDPASPEGKRLGKTVKSARHKLKRRLVEPYEANPKESGKEP